MSATQWAEGDTARAKRNFGAGVWTSSRLPQRTPPLSTNGMCLILVFVCVPKSCQMGFQVSGGRILAEMLGRARVWLPPPPTAQGVRALIVLCDVVGKE